MRRVTRNSVLAIAIVLPYGLLATGVTRAFHLRLAHCPAEHDDCENGGHDAPESPRPVSTSKPCSICDQLINSVKVTLSLPGPDCAPVGLVEMATPILVEVPRPKPLLTLAAPRAPPSFC